MKPFSCAIANRDAGEDLIGTAGHYQTYVLIECPLPWAANAFESKSIPATLCKYVNAMTAERSVRFLAINRGTLDAKASITLLVYERAVFSGLVADDSVNTEVIAGYQGYEFQVDNLTQAIDCLESHWQGRLVGQSIIQKDILICTHGMRDSCCARFGQPLFREAMRSASEDKLPNARVWRVSHIGGHRLAPTAISLPDGRYYGRLTLAALKAIVTRRGSIEQLRSVYRGWGLLPEPLQVLERQLMLQQGWSWFDSKVTYRILADRMCKQRSQSSEQNLHTLSVDFSVVSSISQPVETQVETIADCQSQASISQSQTYRAELVQDPQKTVCTKASCSSDVAKPFVKYAVTQCALISQPQSAADSIAAVEKPCVL
ncbi:Sucrase/ferredoxin-like family [Synechococcus sp. PCC 7335]|uniref:sucrase ferredoxin n=1 Tax=Synechococcus sp. (strain ATCC 29403 / PCC 7335) TaxID=91464 RepID=UPI00017EC797|nr:sucrase ferredoxin [Synechococcus sp. PCC 7335]EDX84901.1 Sucrase/ferredoxin-like family [Synechococcus sp. PCC 7335]